MPPLTLLTLTLTIAAPAAKDPPKKEGPSLVGDWAIEAVTVGGQHKQVPPRALRFTFQADGTLAVQDGGAPRPLTYKADPKADPAHLDIIPPAAAGRSPSWGIYKIDGDTLTICLDQAPGSERPKDFASPAGSLMTVYVFKRVKAKD
jgi:uncharacterized protein (TIGR03067 family)